MESMTRRDMLKGMGAGAAAAAVCAGMQTAQAEEAVVFENSVAWDAEYDAIVLGTGFAGMCAAIEAADQGQKVLMVDKAPYAVRGGNSRVTCGYYASFVDGGREGFIDYVYAMCGEEYISPTRQDIEQFADLMDAVTPWLQAHGSNPIVQLEEGPRKDLAGYQDFKRITENGHDIYNAAYYNVLARVMDNHENIDIWYSAPAKRLIQDPQTKIVHGVEVEVGGELYKVRSLDGVVIATGGFAANQKMVQDYLRLPYASPLGNTYATGDGIKLATAVGADLYHMCAMCGPDFNVPNKTTGTAWAGGTIHIRGHNGDRRESNGFTTGSAIIVGADGTRFCDESRLPDHGFENFHGQMVTVPVSLPAYVVFDRAQFDAVPVYPIWDNAQKVEEGEIVEAQTLAELAEALGLPAGSLDETVSVYNGYCAQGFDPEFTRMEDDLHPIAESGPYYAVEIWPSLVNTQGGPIRNLRTEIIDVEGNVIPHLYGAGECGTLWGNTYPGGCNIGDAFGTGIEAGKRLAEKKDDNYRQSCMDGKEPVDFTEEPPTFQAEAENEYVGVGYGMGGALWVKVMVQDSQLESVQILHNYETPTIGDVAVARVPQMMNEAHSIDVDDISGATCTSRAIKDAVKDALVQAGVLDADYEYATTIGAGQNSQ